MKMQQEFVGERARMYELAIAEFPDARRDDIDAMHLYLNPQKGERILGLGEGNGYFASAIAESLGNEGKYVVTDPSEEQLENLKVRVMRKNIDVIVIGAEEIDFAEEEFDKVWSFGAFHHCENQTEAMKRVYRSLKKRGKLVLCDVFQGSDLARHFDTQVARYCISGHEVNFLSDDFARSLAYLAGFSEEKLRIEELNQKWRFNSGRDLGRFIYNIHAMSLLPGDEDEKAQRVYEGCRDILGIEKRNGQYELNWPMRVLIAEK